MIIFVRGLTTTGSELCRPTDRCPPSPPQGAPILVPAESCQSETAPVAKNRAKKAPPPAKLAPAAAKAAAKVGPGHACAVDLWTPLSPLTLEHAKVGGLERAYRQFGPIG